MLRCPYVINCEEVFKWKGKIWVFLEFLEDGDLTNLPKNYSENFCKYTMYQVALGIQALHNQNILHRDIKAENILHRSTTGDIKLADMGLSVILCEQEEYRKSVKGTTAFLSPEIAQGILYGKEVDIWAFGCFAYELASGKGKMPFGGMGEAGIIDAILDMNKPAPAI